MPRRVPPRHWRAGGPGTSSWINELPKNARRKLATIGLIESRRAAAGVAPDIHVADFTTALNAKGNTSRHVELVTGRIRSVIEGCRFNYWSDITAAKVQNQPNIPQFAIFLTFIPFGGQLEVGKYRLGLLRREQVAANAQLVGRMVWRFVVNYGKCDCGYDSVS